LAIIDLFSSVLSRPASRILEGSVRTLVNDLIRDHDLASAAEVDTLRRSLRGLDTRAGDILGKLEQAQSELDELRSALQAADQRLAESNSALESATAKLARLESSAHEHQAQPKPAAQPTPTSKPADSDTPLACRVAGCTIKHRSKGFCSPHYQRWRRGTLPGFIMPDGKVTQGDKSWQVGKKSTGKPYEIKRGRLYIDGKAV